MSTLSFQEYVRERMLRKRREAMQDSCAGRAAPPAPAPRSPQPRRAACHPCPMPAADPIVVPVQRFNEPEQRQPSAAAWASSRSAPAKKSPAWEDSQPSVRFASNEDTRMAVELSALKDMIEERFNTLAWLGSSKQNPIQSNLMLKMIRAGYSPAMARAVLERVPADAGAPEAFRWLMDVLTRNLKVSSPTAGLCDEGGVVSLIGATGVGKTTTAAKLAAQCVKQYGAASVGMITLDTYRVSGYEQLRAYGRMLGVVAHLAHDRAALKDLLNLLSGKRLVIIDTAGLGQRDQRIQDMLDVLDMPKVKKTLVLNAGSHGDTLDETLTSFKASSLHGVVLSKVDEAVKLGPALDALIRHQVTLRGVANGQRVPEDWQNPDAVDPGAHVHGHGRQVGLRPGGHRHGFLFRPDQRTRRAPGSLACLNTASTRPPACAARAAAAAPALLPVASPAQPARGHEWLYMLAGCLANQGRSVVIVDGTANESSQRPARDRQPPRPAARAARPLHRPPRTPQRPRRLAGDARCARACRPCRKPRRPRALRWRSRACWRRSPRA